MKSAIELYGQCASKVKAKEMEVYKRCARAAGYGPNGKYCARHAKQIVKIAKDHCDMVAIAKGQFSER